MDDDVQRARKPKDIYRPTIDIDLERTTIEGPNYRIIIEYKNDVPEVIKKKKLVV